MLDATAVVNLWHGSIRAGKTWASTLAWLDFIARRAPSRGELFMIGKTRDTLERNVLRPLIDDWGPDADKIIKFTPGANSAAILGRRVDILGANDARAETRIRGATVAGAYVDEGSLLPDEGYWNQLRGRMSLEGAAAFVTTNPDNPFHWLKVGPIDKADEYGFRVWHFDLDDNPGLSESFKEQIRRENTGVFYKRNIEGLWVIAEGVIYDMLDLERHVVHVLPGIVDWVVAVDPGAAGTHAAVLLGLGTDDRLWVAGEWRWVASERGRRLTDLEAAGMIAAWLDAFEVEHGRTVDVWKTVVDPAGASMITQLHRDNATGGRHPGRFGSIRQANNKVVPGIRHVGSLLAADRMRIASWCEGLIAEKQTYSWDPKAAERGEDAPVKANDHSCDAERYGVEATVSWWGHWISEPIEDEAA